MDLKTGDILLVDTEGFIPSKIDVFQGNDFNHAGFIVCIYGKTYVFEAIDSGMAFTPFEDYQERLGKEDIRLLILRPLNDVWEYVPIEDLMNFILPLTKGFYAYFNLIFYQAVKYVWKYLFRKELWIGRSQKKVIDKGSYICGQLVARIYNYFFGWYSKEWHKIAPVDLYNDKRYDHIKYE